MKKEKQDQNAVKQGAGTKGKVAHRTSFKATSIDTKNHARTMGIPEVPSTIAPSGASRNIENMSQQEVSAMVDTKKRNRMQNTGQKINQLRELAKQGRSREDICETMGISRQNFETLRHRLSDIDREYYYIPFEKPSRGHKVGKAGIMISMDRLVAMGADKIFEPETAISIWLDGDCIMIQRPGRKRPPLLRGASQDGTLGVGMEADLDALFDNESGEA